MPRLLVIQHVPHERLGTFEDGLRQAGCSIRPLSVDEPRADWPRVQDLDGIISMGGPMSVYERTAYPWMQHELVLLRQAVQQGLPVLGVCLGAQMLAASLGAKVTPNPQKEIGWYPLMREPGADGDPLFAAFGSTETVFQWHGDTFDLPKGAVHLASSPLCRQQAFRVGDRAYGVQFHVEVTEAMIRAWMQKNRAELAKLQGIIDPMAIRQQTARHLRRLQELAQHVATTFASLLTRTPAHARAT